MGIKAATSFSLKDDLFNATTVAWLGRRLANADGSVNEKKFCRDVLAAFAGLALKERIQHMVTVLETTLPADFDSALDVLERSLPEPLDPSLSDDDFGHFIWVVPGEYVARHGCTDDRVDKALVFLREATKRFSSESAIRPFLNAYPTRTLAFLRQCARDPNYHVRRLASEGIRPYLPWAQRVIIDPNRVVSVLDLLHADPTRYVTRSVANTLNDLSRTDAQLVIDTLRRWRRLKRQQRDELGWMVRHSLRTLLKDNKPAALQLLGYRLKPKFRLSKLSVSRRVAVGSAFVWQCRLISLARQRLQVVLRIGFLKANGSHSERVFAVADGQFDVGESLEIDKRQPFRPLTTRVLYPGRHYAELVVNGVASKRVSFEVVP